MSVKRLFVLVTLGAGIADTTFAQVATTADNYARASQHGWSSRVHVYAPGYYVPWYDSYGNGNINPDRQLAR
jgi:hypothetical protein